MKELKDEELEKITGGAGNSTVYVAAVFRDGIDEEEVEGYYYSQSAAFDAACEKVQELLRITADRRFIVKVYYYDPGTQAKEEVYSEEIFIDDYYRQI